MSARFATEPVITAASSFTNLDVAERTLHCALKVNRSAIEAWARTARPGRTKAFEYVSPDAVGHGVVRATNLFTQTKKTTVVLKMQAHNGKPHYILTAFPSF